MILKDTCPLCGAPVTYRGLVALECMGRKCPNWDKVEPKQDWPKLDSTIEFDLGSWGIWP